MLQRVFADSFRVTPRRAIRDHVCAYTRMALLVEDRHPLTKVKSSTFAGNRYPRGQQPWEVLSLPVDPLGEVCPKGHPRQRLPPPALPHYASGSYPLARFVTAVKLFLTKMPSPRRALLGGWRPRELGGPLHGALFED